MIINFSKNVMQSAVAWQFFLNPQYHDCYDFNVNSDHNNINIAQFKTEMACFIQFILSLLETCEDVKFVFQIY